MRRSRGINKKKKKISVATQKFLQSQFGRFSC